MFVFLSLKIVFNLEDSADPDEMLHSRYPAASNLGLYSFISVSVHVFSIQEIVVFFFFYQLYM